MRPDVRFPASAAVFTELAALGEKSISRTYETPDCQLPFKFTVTRFTSTERAARRKMLKCWAADRYRKLAFGSPAIRYLWLRVELRSMIGRLFSFLAVISKAMASSE